jgi:predicted kinase
MTALSPCSVREFTFKHTYIAYDRSAHGDNWQNRWACEHRIATDPFAGSGDVIARLPWGPGIQRIGDKVVAFYHEPTPDWKKENRLCRSINLIADESVYASLEALQEVEAFDDTRVAVTLLSGLPAAGKNHWIAANAAASAVISLDALRAELGVAPIDAQGAVVAAAKAEARRLLAAGTPFIWNATNIAVTTRAALIDLFAAYGAKITVVYLEAAEAEMTRRNSARRDPVPLAAIPRMLDRWQPPDLTECHVFTVELS